jgi:hypothetical protein
MVCHLSSSLRAFSHSHPSFYERFCKDVDDIKRIIGSKAILTYTPDKAKIPSSPDYEISWPERMSEDFRGNIELGALTLKPGETLTPQDLLLLSRGPVDQEINLSVVAEALMEDISLSSKTKFKSSFYHGNSAELICCYPLLSAEDALLVRLDFEGLLSCFVVKSGDHWSLVAQNDSVYQKMIEHIRKEHVMPFRVERLSITSNIKLDSALPVSLYKEMLKVKT